MIIVRPKTEGIYLAHESDYDKWDWYYFDGVYWNATQEGINLRICNQEVIDCYIEQIEATL